MAEESPKKYVKWIVISIVFLVSAIALVSTVFNRTIVQRPESGYRQELQCIEWNMDGYVVSRYNVGILCQMLNSKNTGEKCNWASYDSTTLIMNFTMIAKIKLGNETIAEVPEYRIFEYKDCLAKDYLLVQA